MSIEDIQVRLTLAQADISMIKMQLEERNFASAFRGMETVASDMETLRETAIKLHQTEGLIA